MKYCYYGLVRRYVLSRPARGAWVEIFPMGERFAALTWSRPARGAWVEILVLLLCSRLLFVAPRKGRVG